MNSAMRWVKFNLVGAMGMAVQLGALHFINHVVPGHYLASSATSVELAILHNFAWHRRYTWTDRAAVSLGRSLARFQAANGLVSLISNLVLMHLFVGLRGWPVMAANIAAIAACSLINFCLGDGWVLSDQRCATGEDVAASHASLMPHIPDARGE